MYLDAHIHLWELDDGEHFWMRDKIAGLHRDFTEQDLRALRAKCKVGGAIVVQACHTISETRKWLARAVKSDQLAGVIGWLDLFSPNLAAEVAVYRASPKFVGLRPLPQDTFGGDWLSDPRSKTSIKLLQSLDVSIDTLQRMESLPRARAFFREFPGLRLVLNHGGRPAVMTGILEPWRSEIRAFARETSAVVKCSGLVERAGVEWDKATVKPYVATLLEEFGAKRIMFATNWPVSTISSTYDLWVNTLAEILDDLGLTSDEKDDVMWRTAAQHYRVKWPL
ncbi:MAG: amidohydrolase family protein [Casimicrobiaceae bacterium]